MSNHSNDLDPFRLRRARANQDALPHGRLPPERLTGKQVIDDHEITLRKIVLLRKRAPRQQGHPHGFEISRQHGLNIRRLKFAGIGQRISQTPPDRTESSRQRKRSRRGHALYSRNYSQPIFNFTHRDRSLLRFLCSPVIAIEFERQQMVRIESRIRMLQIEETAQHQARSHQQHERECDFDHHHRAAQRVAPQQSGIPPTAAQQKRYSRLGRTPRRQHAKNRGCRQADQRRKSHHHKINADRLQPGQIFRRKNAQQANPHPRQQQTNHCTGRRQDQCLAQQRTHQPPPAPPQSRAHRKFPLTQRSSHEQKIRHVGACDQQQEDRRTHQRQDRRAHIRDQVLSKRFQIDVVPRCSRDHVVLAILCRDLIGGLLCLLHAHAGTQPADGTDTELIAVRRIVVQPIGNPDVRCGLFIRFGRKIQMKVRRQHSHYDGRRLSSAGNHGMPEDRRVPPEAPLEIFVTEDCDERKLGRRRASRCGGRLWQSVSILKITAHRNS